MNLIGNSCTASFITRFSNKQFTNPFTWTAIDFNSYYNLITNFNKIDFMNYRLGYLIDKNVRRYHIVIDNLVNVFYVHYRYKASATKLETLENPNSVDVFYNKIDEFIEEKYVTRTKRMMKLNEAPVFIFDCFNTAIIGTPKFRQIQSIADIHSNYKRLILTPNSIKPNTHNNSKIINFRLNDKGKIPDAKLVIKSGVLNKLL